MAFVVIMRLSANHESHAAEILQTTTKMPVFQIVESIEVEPNSIYVILPSKHLAMNDGHISLIEPRPLQFGQQVSIDLFFARSATRTKTNRLASCCREWARAEPTV